MSEPIPESSGRRVEFFVPGLPQPGGSKRGFYIPKIKRVVITDANARSKDWRANVALVASENVKQLFAGPLRVAFHFRLPRPKGHLGKNGVRKSAPAHPAVKPDVLKLSRSTEDALTGVAWTDDAQIVDEWITKGYAEPGQPIGAVIGIEEVKETTNGRN